MAVRKRMERTKKNNPRIWQQFFGCSPGLRESAISLNCGSVLFRFRRTPAPPPVCRQIAFDCPACKKTAIIKMCEL